MHIGEVNTLRSWSRIAVMLLPRCDARDPTNDAVCSDYMCRERGAWPWLFLSVDGRYRSFEGCLLGCLTAYGGWVRKHAIPVDEGGGLAWGKPPSLNSLRISFPKYPVYIPF